MNTDELVSSSRPFLEWAVEWHNNLEHMPVESAIVDPARTAVLSVDVLRGFCCQGPLASERVGSIVGPVVKLFEAAHARGVQHFVLAQDAHPADAVEFQSYPPHCVAGTVEAEPVPELAQLPFVEECEVIQKNSISSSVGTALPAWLEARPQLDTFIVVGDCTDLCTYQLAMYLRLRANAMQLPGVRVILPVDAVETYDLPVEAAQEVGAVPHHGDLLHLIFLYSLMLNGVEVVAGVGQ